MVPKWRLLEDVLTECSPEACLSIADIEWEWLGLQNTPRGEWLRIEDFPGERIHLFSTILTVRDLIRHLERFAPHALQEIVTTVLFTPPYHAIHYLKLPHVTYLRRGFIMLRRGANPIGDLLSPVR